MTGFCDSLRPSARVRDIRFMNYRDVNRDEVARGPIRADRLAKENDEGKSRRRKNDEEDTRSRNRVHVRRGIHAAIRIG